MILFEYSFFIDKGKEEEYLNWSKETGTPYWLKQPSVKLMRSYTTRGTNQRKVIVEMESMEAWGKLMDDPEMIAIQKVFADYVNNLKWTIWDEAGRLK